MPGLPAIESYPLPRTDMLPASIAGWQLDPDRAVLLVHDMQRYFLSPFASELRNPLVDNCSTLRNRCEALDIPVYYTAQPGDMTERQRGLLKDIWGSGMRAAPEDREIVAELSPSPKDCILTKWRYSAFHKSSLLEQLQASGRDQIILCGVFAHVGILATAIEAFTNDIQPFLVADAVADFSAAHHQMAIDYAASRCAVVVTTEGVFA